MQPLQKVHIRDDPINGLHNARSFIVTCGSSGFIHGFPCSKKITGEHIGKTVVEQWLEPYRARTEVHFDDDVRIWSNTGWYK